MNKALRRVSVFAALMVLALLVNVTVNYAWRSAGLLSDPGNRRVVDAQFDAPRGSILVGTPLAHKELLARLVTDPC